MPVGRNLVVSVDGTTNQFGPFVSSSIGLFAGIYSHSTSQNTNVVELHSRIIRNSTPVLLKCYLSGIGTYVPPSTGSLSYLREKLWNKIDMSIAW